MRQNNLLRYLVHKYRGGKGIAAAGLDLNQLNSYRAFAFALLQGIKNPYDLEAEPLSLEDWAALLGLLSYEPAEKAVRVENAPDRAGEFFRVPRIIED